MHDFKCNDPKDMYYKNLAERADHLKNTEGGREEVCKIMEEIKSEGVRQEKYQIAIRMLADGALTHEQISKYTKLPIETIKELASQLSSITA